ncbi:MAG: dipeptidase [Marinibacterium sp.]|nr:dipeptidase [Marinibacterium sp.]
MRTFGKWLGRLILLALVAGAVVFFGILPPRVERGMNLIHGDGRHPVSDAAQALHDDLLIGDWHADSLLWARDLNTRADRGHVDIPRLQEGNVALQFFTAVTKSPAGQNYTENSADSFDNITPLVISQMWPPRTWQSLLERALYQAEKLHEFQADAPDDLRIIRTRSDLDAVLDARANGSQIVGGLLGIEGAHPLELKLENLDALEAAGHRMIGLHHFFDNGLGGSLHGLSNAGLTDFGRDVVAEVARRNLILDLAHSSPQVAWEVLEMTDMPIVVSHTGLHSFCPVKRNFPDDLMKAIAETGGVIAIGYWDDVACGDFAPAGIARMIAAAIDVLGEDHVALGSDYDGSVKTTFDTSQLAALTHALMHEGLSEDQIRKVMGGNMVRVLRARLPA